MSFKFKFTAFLLLMPVASHAMTLQQIIDILPEHNHTLKAAKANLEAEKERLTQARAAFLPSVNASASTGLQEDYSTNKYRSGTVTLNQPLFTGGRDIAAYKNIKSSIASTEATFNNTYQQQVLATINAYLNVLSAKTQLEQTAQYVELLTEQHKAEQTKKDSGESSYIDVMQSVAFLEEAKAQHAFAQAAVEEALQNLLAQMGDYTNVVEIDDLSWPELPELPTSPEEAKTLSTQHPQIISALANEEAAKSLVSGAKGQLLPTLAAKATASVADWSSPEHSETLGLTLSVPLFAGGSNLSQIRQAKYNHLAAKDTKNSALQTIQKNAVIAYHNFIASELSYKARKTAEDAQKEATKGIKARHKEGESSLLDALEADQDYLDAQTAAIKARQVYIYNAYALLAAVGTL